MAADDDEQDKSAVPKIIQNHIDLQASVTHKLATVQFAILQHTQRETLLDVGNVRYYQEELNKLYTNVEILHKECFTLFEDNETDQSRTQALVDHETIARTHRELSVKLTEILSTFGASGVLSRLRMPTVEPPAFSGKAAEWCAFRDQFKNLVADNGAIGPTDKLIMLKNSLAGGSSKSMVDNMELTEHNWTIAWAAVQLRFHNQREIAHSTIKPLFDLPVINRQNSNQIIKMIDTINSVQTALQAMKVNAKGQAWDLMISHIILQRLDAKSQIEFEKSLEGPELHTLQQLIKFLSNTASAIAATEYLDLKNSSGSKTKYWKPNPNFRSQTFATTPTQRPSTRTNPSQNKGDYKQNPKPNQAPVKNQVPNKPFDRSKNFPRKIRCGYCQANDHLASHCPQLIKIPVPELRYSTVLGKLCTNCLSSYHTNPRDCKSKSGCIHCTGRHHTMFHKPTVQKGTQRNYPTTNHLTPLDYEEFPQSFVMTFTNTNSSLSVILPTAIVHIDTGYQKIKARCLVDTASQVSLISLQLVKGLQIEWSKQPCYLRGAGHSDIQNCVGKCSLKITSSRDIHPLSVETLIMKKMTSNLPTQSFNIQDWEHLNGIDLADPNFNKTNQIDMLLGADIVGKIWCPDIIHGKKGQPNAYKTKFGWIIFGALENKNSKSFMTNMINETKPPFTMEKFWEIENLPEESQLTPEEEACEAHFKATTIRLPTGRYQCDLPFKINHPSLGQSYNNAIARWLSVERRIEGNLEIRKQYHNFLNDYLVQGHMEQVYDIVYPIPTITQNKSIKECYLPHHNVMRESSSTTKLRCVFDGSCKTSNGVSLNSILMVGAQIQPFLINQILKFRLHKYAMTADIKAMYRQIMINPKDRDYLKIVWRKTDSPCINTYRLSTVSYGTSCAPFQATRVLQKLSEDESKTYPVAASVLRQDFYMDDLLTGSHSMRSCLELQSDLIALCKSGGFELRKWATNHQKLLDKIPPEDREIKEVLSLEPDSAIKILGISWETTSDMFKFHIPENMLNPTDKLTKRLVLSKIGSLFDPLGFLSPVTFFAKTFMQKLWQTTLDWDQELTIALKTEWSTFAASLPILNTFTIRRHVGYDPSSGSELHGFCDASEKGYSAAIYLVILKKNKTPIVNLIMAKTRVAPLKQLTLPRLELCGALLVAELMQYIQRALPLSNPTLHYWCDSSIVLYWINSTSSTFKTFISNRIAKIQSMSTSEQWHHVPSNENAADPASRGLSPIEFMSCSLWIKGPEFLYQDILPIKPIPGTIPGTKEQELKKIKILATLQQEHDVLASLSKISKWNSVLHTLAYITRLKRVFEPKSSKSKELSLSINEITRAELTLIQMIQDHSFPKEVKILKEKGLLNKSSPILNLNPVWGEDGLIRVGGRLSKAINLDPSRRHPIILPRSHPLIKALVMHHHKQFHHLGVQALLNHMRHKYWLPHGRRTISHIINKCMICYRFKAKPRQQMMAPLPEFRVTPSRPFTHTGTDYFGPVYLRNPGRRSKSYKGWVALFTCMTTRAVHVELVTSLSTEAFLDALRRFMNRRGRVLHLYSDQGTQYVGAKNQLKREMEIMIHGQSHEIAQALLKEGVTWHLMPPLSPSMGGIWEICVKLMKTHLKKMFLKDSYSIDEYITMLSHAEAVVNSRPLTPLSEDPDDLEVLTPAHFLIGESLLLPPEPNLSHLRLNRLNRFQLIQRKMQDYWQQWSIDYLQTLQKRHKWKTPSINYKVDDLVLILDDQLPPFQWRLGRIKQIHPGSDLQVRVVTLEVAGGYTQDKGKLKRITKTFQRSIAKIAPLPDALEEEEQPQLLNSIHHKQKSKLIIKEPSAKQTSQSRIRLPTSMLQLAILLIIVLICGSATEAKYDWGPRTYDLFPACPNPYDHHYETPPCVRTIDWINIQETGAICSRRMNCYYGSSNVIDPDGKTCVPFSEPCTNATRRHVRIDDLKCQTHQESPSNANALTTPEEQSQYCEVGQKVLRSCSHFTEQVDDVPIVIIKGFAYPVRALNLQMTTQANTMTGYICKGCEARNCEEGHCNGDFTFCKNFPCHNNNTDCYCSYDRSSEFYLIATKSGIPVVPDCWGMIRTTVKKEDLSVLQESYVCPECEIKCTKYGISFESPDNIPTYLKVIKNPGHVSLVPESKLTEIHLSKNMLASGGNFTIESWYKHHDSPTLFSRTCPRIPVCDLIKCLFCIERLGNVQCYIWYHWVLLSTGGLIIALNLMALIWITKGILLISWLIFWPFRLCLQYTLQATKKKVPALTSPKKITNQETQESEHENELKEIVYPQLAKQKRSKTQKYLYTVMQLTVACILISPCFGCSNSALLSAKSKECHYSSNGEAQCSVRINTRLALSPLGQISCLQLTDLRKNLLGSVIIETRSVALKCLKQALYFIPKPKENCQSVRRCYSLWTSDDCNGDKCIDFTLNSTISEFKPSLSHLGWNFCAHYYDAKCHWIQTQDCHFFRLSLENPTQEAYEVFFCPDWTYTVTLNVKLTLGNQTTEQTLKLTSGVPHIMDHLHFSLVSLSTPPIPLLNKCVVMTHNRATITDCNTRGNLVLGTIGEIQCPTLKDAKELNNNCISSPGIIRTLTSTAGIQCFSEFINPEFLLNQNPLPLALENGIFIPTNGTIQFETSSTTLLEIQIDSDNVQIVKKVTSTTCSGSFIKLEGCYSCIGGAVLTLEGRIEEGINTAIFECPEIDFFIPLNLGPETRREKIIMKFDYPHINQECNLKCTQNTVPLQISGTLDYLTNTDGRVKGMSVSYDPLKSQGRFSIWSLTGLGWFQGMARGIAAVILIFIIVMTLLASIKGVLRKMI